MSRAVLEDDFHAEQLKEFDSLDQAMVELRHLEVRSSDELTKEIGPTPCMGRCGRRELLVYAEGRVVGRAKPITKKP